MLKILFDISIFCVAAIIFYFKNPMNPNMFLISEQVPMVY